MEECLKADAVHGYRNKCEFSYGRNEEKEKMVGFRVGRYVDQNLTVESARDICIVRESMKQALVFLEEHVKSSKFDIYCPASYEVSLESEKMMMIVILSKGHWQTVMMRSSGSDQDSIQDGVLKADVNAGLVLTFTFIRNDVSEEELEIARYEF